MPQTYPVHAIANLLLLTERRVQQLVKDGILPRPRNGAYEPVPCVRAYIDYQRKLIIGTGELSLTDERTRLTKYQADLAEIDLQKARGSLLESKVAMQMWSDVVTTTRQKFLGLSTRLAPTVIDCKLVAEVKEKIDRAVYEILTELASPDFSAERTGEERTRGDKESLAPIPAPAPAHRKRVGRRKAPPQS